MSKKVKSDGTVERTLLKFVGDNSCGRDKVAIAISRSNLNQCSLKAITKIKEIWQKRFGHDKQVIHLIEEFEAIRKKQSPKFRNLNVDYDILFGQKPQDQFIDRPCGAAKPIEDISKESNSQLIGNLQKCMQSLDAGGRDPVEYLEEIINNNDPHIAAEIIYVRLSERMKNIRATQAKRLDELKNRLNSKKTLFVVDNGPGKRPSYLRR